MSLLLDKAPETVVVDGRMLPIAVDFRTSIRFELLIQGSLSGEEKVREALKLYYGERPPETQEAVERLLWFYRCGADEPEKGGGKSGASRPHYSFEADAPYIYAAFRSQYGIDLQQAELHWWAFKALLLGLTDCRFTEIVGYRSIEISEDMPKEQKKFYRKMKALYRLPDGRSAEEKEAEFVRTMGSMF